MKKFLLSVVAATTVLALTACEGMSDGGTTRADREAPVAGKSHKADQGDKGGDKGVEDVDAPEMTTAQENAVRTANDYLDYSAFSRSGLIKQLKFDGFTIKDATFAVDTIKPDWNKQAALAAKDYLDYSGFSRSGLITQLKFDGFTDAQAAYGVKQNGL